MGNDTENQHEEVGPAGGAAGGAAGGTAVLVAAALPAFGDKGHDDGKDYHKGNRGGGDDPALSQESEQDAESGDIDQSFNVSNRGDRGDDCKAVRSYTGGCEFRQRLEPD